MTEERSRSDIETVDGIDDPLVSRAYREAATERAPETLDATVLHEARQQASGRDYSPYSKWIYWLRPTAWAATITLSLAIVLQVVDVPQDAIDETSFRPDSITEPRGEVDAAAPPAGRIAPSNNAVGAASNGERAMSSPVSAPAEASEDVRTQEELQLFHLEDAPLVQQAEDLARMREGPAREQSADSLTASSPALSAKSETTACSDEETAQPATWLECIERLEDAGENALAVEQRDLLQLAFPDFELPE